MSKYYHYGYEAGINGEYMLSCPYVGQAAKDWMKGWEDGYNERAEQKESNSIRQRVKGIIND